MTIKEIKFILTLPEIPKTHRTEAEKKAKEAYVLTPKEILDKHGQSCFWISC